MPLSSAQANASRNAGRIFLEADIHNIALSRARCSSPAFEDAADKLRRLALDGVIPRALRLDQRDAPLEFFGVMMSLVAGLRGASRSIV